MNILRYIVLVNEWKRIITMTLGFTSGTSSIYSELIFSKYEINYITKIN